MKRKDFLAITIPIGSVLSSIGQSVAGQKIVRDHTGKIPPYLVEGDMIGITSPSGYISLEDIQPAIKKLSEWGFKVKVGNSVGRRDHTFGGTDEERCTDLQNMLDDPKLKAILFARGGYGGVRIVDKLNFARFLVKPKWIIGFSDATVFLSHLHANFGIASIHSKMCNSFPKDWSQAEPAQIETINSIRDCITGVEMKYKVSASMYNRYGSTEGLLIGGNLSILENMSGSKSDINTDGKILFIEEVDEYLYSIDRMLWNLSRSGKFKKLKGLVVGGFNRIKADDPGEEFGMTTTQMILEKVKDCNYPVCFDFPVGHQKNNFALKCGVMHKLKVGEDGVELVALV